MKSKKPKKQAKHDSRIKSLLTRLDKYFHDDTMPLEKRVSGIRKTMDRIQFEADELAEK